MELFACQLEACEHGSRREAERRAVDSLVRKAFGPGASVVHDRDGAPSVEGADVCVSLSHCEGMCVLAVNDVPVGVDVETPRPQLLRIADKFLTHREKMEYSHLSLNAGFDRTAYLLHLWTAKEAVFKCAGLSDLVVSEIEIFYTPFGQEAKAEARGLTFGVSYSDISRCLIAVALKL